MSMSSIASTAVSGLLLAQGKVAAEADNLVNADTPGYDAVTVEGRSLVADGVGAGVSGVTRSNLDVQGAVQTGSTGTDVAESFVNMIAAEHAYKAGLQVLKASDEMSRQLTDLMA